MKILTGEDGTRKPLFKVESMSDYAAVSRASFITLKKRGDPRSGLAVELLGENS